MRRSYRRNTRALDPLSVHRAWLGLVQPDGIVVSAAAMAEVGLAPDPLAEGEIDALRRLCGLKPEADAPRNELLEAPQMRVQAYLARLFVEVLGCDADWLVGTEAQPFGPASNGLERVLPEFHQEVLAPTYALRNPNVGERHADSPWLCLLKEYPIEWNLDRAHGDHGDTHWVASPMAKMERLLRETGVALGVVSNGETVRVMYAPPGEGAGVIAFPLALLLGDEADTSLGALVMLLGRARWLDGTSAEPGAPADPLYLPRILAASRRYQNSVSTRLAAQVLEAFWELLRGFEDANRRTGGALLHDWQGERTADIYAALLAVLLRLVFLLYAEDRDQLPSTGFYPAHYGIRSLFDKLRDDAGRHPDTMDQRQGAWARLLATFRLVHQGGGHGDTLLPPRQGALFSPDTHPFLEGRPLADAARLGEAVEVPAVSDGVVLRVLERLLRVDREDLSYKTLSVEELGSVYESMMGYTVERTTGPSLALQPHGAVVDLADLLAEAPAGREKWLKAEADTKPSATEAEALRAAKTVDALADALQRKTIEAARAVLPKGTLVLQPTAERRRSGSHYTPRTLTEPIVERTLRPVFEALGPAPTHAQILGLAVCDPAMGSGAFLVAACRWLGERLYTAWMRDGRPPEVARLSPDDDERVVARRLVAQHCLYGVDKNPFAVDLARLSLWLETLAKEHPFTFLDHCLREGDSLVGATRAQMERISLEVPKKTGTNLNLIDQRIQAGLNRAQADRAAIRGLALSDDTGEKRRLLDEANAAVAFARQLGDALVGTFFAESSTGGRKKAAEKLRSDALAAVSADLLQVELNKARAGLKLRPFHWEVEFPEVFARDNPGFDAVVGNPPFIWGNRIGKYLGDDFRDWLLCNFSNANGNSDIVAYFFRVSFSLLSAHGCMGLIATNSIAQTDTREVGLAQIKRDGGCIYAANTNRPWDTQASVLVSVVHISKRQRTTATLNGVPVTSIEANLTTTAATAASLPENKGHSFKGVDFGGTGFILDPDEAASLVKRSPGEEQFIRPLLNAQDLNDSPTQRSDRLIINLSALPLEDAERLAPCCLEIVRERVKPSRDTAKRQSRQERWWIFNEPCHVLYSRLSKLRTALVNPSVSKWVTFCHVTSDTVFTNALNIFPTESDGFFAVMQSRVHEVWARFFGSSLEDRLRYTPSDCFETFPFPAEWQDDATLDALGARYHAERAAWMVAHGLGLTKFYNAFHDPDCDDAGVVALRALHAEMDRAVLRAYGWNDLADALSCEFQLEHTAEEEGTEGRARTRKKPWRLRWPEATRDEVLGRLLALNAERAAGEKAAQEAAVAAEAAERQHAAVAKSEGRALRLVAPPSPQKVGETLRDYLRAQALSETAYCVSKGRAPETVAAMLTSTLTYELDEPGTLAAALSKTLNRPYSECYEVLMDLVAARRTPSRARPLAMAARRKREDTEP